MSWWPRLLNPAAAAKCGHVARAKSAFQKLRSIAAFRPSDFQPRIGLQLGLTDPVCGMNMGETAELLAREHGITRELQDSFPLEYHRKGCAALNKLGK